MKTVSTCAVKRGSVASAPGAQASSIVTTEREPTGPVISGKGAAGHQPGHGTLRDCWKGSGMQRGPTS